MGAPGFKVFFCRAWFGFAHGNTVWLELIANFEVARHDNLRLTAKTKNHVLDEASGLTETYGFEPVSLFVIV